MRISLAWRDARGASCLIKRTDVAAARAMASGGSGAVRYSDTASSDGRQTTIQTNHLAADEVGGIGGKEVH
jgi:hypothetical protein